jgi:hypothetical protein
LLARGRDERVPVLPGPRTRHEPPRSGLGQRREDPTVGSSLLPTENIR